jgi:hypothetical protein
MSEALTQALLFTSLGVAGSAFPAHYGMRVLSHRQQLDKQLAFAPGPEHGGLAYSWWLMRFRQRELGDAPLRSFGNIAGVMGWITLLGIIGSTVAIALRNF